MFEVMYLNKLLCDRAKEVEAGLYLGLGVLGLHSCRDHRDEPALGGHLVGVGHHRNVDVALPADLLLWDYDLG